MKKIIIGNWKLNLDHLEAIQLLQKLNYTIEEGKEEEIDIVVSPSHTSLRSIQTIIDTDKLNIQLSAQDVSQFSGGAYTGEVSSHQLNKLNVSYCIVGHSERRTIFKEDNELIEKKLNNCLDNINSVILCIGESLKQKEQNQTFEVIKKQLSILPKELMNKELIIAYEPVWAIGTGMVASKEYIKDVLSYINNLIKELYSNENDSNISLFYGGSVDENTVEELSTIPLLDGFLIGSASADFGKFKNILNKMR